MREDLKTAFQWLFKGSPPHLAPEEFSGVLIVAQKEFPVSGQMVPSPLGQVGVVQFEAEVPPIESDQSYDLITAGGVPYLIRLEHKAEGGAYIFQTTLPGGIDAAVTYGIG